MKTKEISEEGANRQFKNNFFFDFHNQSLSIGGKTKRITEKESDILRYLSDHRNRLIKREEMLQELWGENEISREEPGCL